MTYSTHRGYKREPTVQLRERTYDPDSFEGMEWEKRAYIDERLNQEMESLEVAKVALVAKQHKGK